MAAPTFRYESTDVPPGMKLDEWRRTAEAERQRPGLLRRLALALLSVART
jgi:hypothetical protein